MGLLTAAGGRAEAACEIDPPSICPSEPYEFGGSDAICDELCIDVAPGAPVTLLCDLGARRDHDLVAHANAFGVAVRNDLLGESGSLCDGNYCFWGRDVTGTEFLCEFDTFGDNLKEFYLKGGEADDQLFFWYYRVDNPEHTFKLDAWHDEEGFTGRMEGLGGDDELQGSNSEATNYVDKAFGGEDDDSVCTYAGDDEGHGDQGEDDIDCSTGDDLCSGGSEDDRVCSGDGDDIALGGTNDDIIFSGLETTDSVDGGLGTDYCDQSTCDTLGLGDCPW